jgi:hypothetical protein
LPDGVDGPVEVEVYLRLEVFEGDVENADGVDAISAIARIGYFG